MQNYYYLRKQSLVYIPAVLVFASCLMLLTLFAFNGEALALTNSEPLALTEELADTNLLCEITTTLKFAEYQAWHGLGSHMQPPPYFSNKLEVIENHITKAKESCIDGFVIDWYGPPSSLSKNNEDREFIDEVTVKLFALAQKHNFKIALMYDGGTLREIAPDLVTTQVISDLKYAEQYFSMESYWSYDDQPVLFIFPYPATEQMIDWGDVRTSLNSELMLIDKDPNPKDLDHDAQFDGFYAWVQPTGEWDPYGAEWGEEYLQWFYSEMMTPTYANKLTVGGVWPSFDDRFASWGTDRLISSRCGQTWLDTLELVKENQPPVLMISTWNDFEESTDIENGILRLVAVNDGPKLKGQASEFKVIHLECENATFLWDFGDGTTGMGLTVTHTYTVPGTYTATVTVTHEGMIYTDTTVVEVKELTPYIWREDFDPVKITWVEENALWERSGSNGVLRESNPSEDFGAVVSEEITGEINKFTSLCVKTLAVDSESAYSIELFDKKTNLPPKELIKFEDEPGKHCFNLISIMSWEEQEQTFVIKIWITGEGQSATFELIEISNRIYLPLLLR